MEKLTPHQWMEKTVKELERKRIEKEKGIKDADQYGYEARLKAYKRSSKIRFKSYKGK